MRERLKLTPIPLTVLVLLLSGCGKPSGDDSGAEEAPKSQEPARDTEGQAKAEPRAPGTSEDVESQAPERPAAGEDQGDEVREEPGEPQPASIPEVPDGELKITKVVVGEELTCALRADARVLCWGMNEHHALGLADLTVDAISPQLIPAVEGVDDLWLDESNSVAMLGSMYGSSSYNSVCVRLKDSGAVRCWGHDEGWILHGGDKPDDARTPVEVPALNKAIDIDFGGGTQCAILEDGSATCWGSNAFKALGRDASPDEKLGFSGYGIGPVKDVKGAVQIAVAQNKACVRTGAGELWCWGNKKDPMKIEHENLTLPISDLSAPVGSSRICVVDGASRVICGERGRWSVVEGITDAVEVAMSTSAMCARDKAGAVQCWCRSLEWSFMTCEKENTPAPLLLPEPATGIAVGNNHGCALLESGRVACWGENRRGQLGDGSLDDRPDPVYISGLDATETTPPPLPDGAGLGAVEWPGEGLEACAATAAPAGENFTPRSVHVTPSRTVEGHWALGLVLSEDIFEGERIPRPRGRGVALKLQVVAREEAQRSLDGDDIAYITKPLVPGIYTFEGGLSLKTRAMSRVGEISLKDARVELTHVDIKGGVVCGTITSSVRRSERKIAGRFAARIAPEVIAAAALVTTPEPPTLRDVSLATGDKLTAAVCDTTGLQAVSHAGESHFESMNGNLERLVITTTREQLVFLDVISADPKACKVEPVVDWGAKGYILPGESPSSIFLDEAGNPTLKGTFGEIYSLSSTGSQEKRCRIRGIRNLAASPDGTLLIAADSTPPLKLFDAKTCEEVGSWENSRVAKCDAIAFIDEKSVVVRCDKELHLVQKGGKLVFTVGKDDYSSPERLPFSTDYLGRCGESVCVRDDEELLLWKLDGTFAGKVDLEALTGASDVLGTAGDDKGLWILAGYQRGKSSSWDSRLLRIEGFPGDNP